MCQRLTHHLILKRLFIYAVIWLEILTVNIDYAVQGCTKRYWRGTPDDAWKDVFEHSDLDDEFEPLVQGGKLAQPGDVPHHVSLKKKRVISGETMYKSFCGASIIGETKLLTAAHCFLTNKKRMKISLSSVMAVAGEAVRLDKYHVYNSHKTGQWRRLLNITSPRYYRYPLNDIALLHVTRKWDIDVFVKIIPFSSAMRDYRGLCMTAGFERKKRRKEPVNLNIAYISPIPRKTCDNTYMKNMRPYVCTRKSRADITKRNMGTGLICYKTRDYKEEDAHGLLVGIQSKVNRWLPSLHTRVSLFHKWIVNHSTENKTNNLLLHTVMSVCLVLSM